MIPHGRALLYAYSAICEFWGTQFTNVKAFSVVRYFRYIFPNYDLLIDLNMVEINK
jgi:hypothetical protein